MTLLIRESSVNCLVKKMKNGLGQPLWGKKIFAFTETKNLGSVSQMRKLW